MRLPLVGRIKNLLRRDDVRTLAGNVVALGFLKGVEFLVPLITVPYLVYAVGLEKYGLLAFSMSLALYFGTLIQYSFSVTAVRDVARARGRWSEVSEIFSENICASVFLVILSGLLIVPIVESSDSLRSDRFIYYSSFFFVALQSLFPAWFFQGIEKMRFIAVINFFTRLAYLVSLIVFIKAPKDYIFVHFLNGCAMLLSVLVSFFIISKKINVDFRFPKLSKLIFLYKSGFQVFLTFLTPNLYNNSALFLLGLHANPKTVGAFGAAAAFVEAMISVGRVISNAFLPYLSRHLQSHGKFSRLMLFFGCILTVFPMIFSDGLAISLFKDESGLVGSAIFLLSIGIFPAFVYLIYGVNFLMLRGAERAAVKASLLASLLAFLVGLVAIPIWPFYGAVSTLVLGRTMLALLVFFAYLRTRHEVVV